MTFRDPCINRTNNTSKKPLTVSYNLNGLNLLNNPSLLELQSSSSSSGYYGIFWLLFASIIFISMDSVAKHLVKTYPVTQVVYMRYSFNLLLLILFLRRQLSDVIKTKHLGIQIIRSLLLLANTGLLFLAYRFIPLAQVCAVMFLSPIIVTLFAAPLLGEHVGVHRWIAVIAGFTGMLIIFKPGSDFLSFASLLPLLGALTYAFYQIMTRKLSHTENPMTTLLYTAIIGTVVVSTIIPAFWVKPDLMGWTMMALLGLLGSIGHFALIKAYQLSNAGTLTPFSYMSLIWAALFGIIFFGEYPEPRVWAGSAVIVCSGLYIFFYERSLVQRYGFKE